MSQIKIGFIGFGNMAKAVATGLVKKNVLPAKQLYACAKTWEKLEQNTKALGIHACKTARELVENSDIVVIAVKPYMIPEVIAPIKDCLEGKIVVSLAAGYSFEKYEQLFLKGTHHISTIPNTPVSIGEGIIVCEQKHSLTEKEVDIFKDIFSKIAIIEFVDTKLLSVAGTVSGCGPAFASMFLEALGDAGVKYGLPRDVAYRLAGQMIAGTGKLHIKTGEHPGKMKDAVCSPSGTTIKGVAALEKNGLRFAVIDAIDAIEG